MTEEYWVADEEALEEEWRRESEKKESGGCLDDGCGCMSCLSFLVMGAVAFFGFLLFG